MSVKSEVLKLLEKNRSAYVSGQEIAEKLGVSRSAVWKAINLLKADGNEILSSTNRGYILSEKSDALSADMIKEFLPDKYKNISVFAYKTLTSTNDEAKRFLSQGNRDAFLIVSDEQTAGRGRNGHSFFSPSKTGIYMTVVIHPNLGFSDATAATTAAACAVVKAIETLTDKKPVIKWVNDVYLDDKKICGILTEAVSDFESGTVQSLIVGIGINITTSIFPSEIEGKAGALNPEKNTRNAIIAEVTKNFLDFSESLGEKKHIEFYKKHSFVLGKQIVFTENGENKEATAIDIDRDGGLVIKTSEGKLRTLSSGEISVKLKSQSN